MTSRERFEKWAGEYGFAYELIDVHQYAKACAWDAWQIAEKQALERAIEVCEREQKEAMKKKLYEIGSGAWICGEAIRALKEQP